MTHMRLHTKHIVTERESAPMGPPERPSLTAVPKASRAVGTPSLQCGKNTQVNLLGALLGRSDHLKVFREPIGEIEINKEICNH